MEITEEIIQYVYNALGEEGRRFFRRVKELKGKINCTLMYAEVLACESPNEDWRAKLPSAHAQKGLPYPIHFHNGVYVRNCMRNSGLCADWDAHDFDNYWPEIVERALLLEKPAENRGLYLL